jgi:DNA-binding NarL/FixJ family response regulator
LSSLAAEISIVLADDNQHIRKGIRGILHQDAEIRLVGEAGNGEEAIHLVERFFPMVVLLDIEMPVLNGIEAARILKVRYPKVKVVFLSAYSERFFIESIWEEGCAGYILKEQVPTVLLQTIHSVLGKS